jgi:hypothetical protein
MRTWITGDHQGKLWIDLIYLTRWTLGRRRRQRKKNPRGYGERFLVDLIPFGVCESRSRPGEEIKETDAGICFFPKRMSHFLECFFYRSSFFKQLQETSYIGLTS